MHTIYGICIVHNSFPATIFTLAYGYKYIETLRLKVKRTLKREPLNKAMYSRSKEFPDYAERPGESSWDYAEEHYVIWKQPNLFKCESIVTYTHLETGKIKQHRIHYLVTKEFLITESDGQKVQKRYITDVEKEMGFDLKYRVKEGELKNSYANYLAVKKPYIYPINYLSDCQIKVIKERKYIDRQAYLIKAYPKNPYLYSMSGNQTLFIGDYVNALIDTHTGVVLFEEVISDNTVVELLKMSELEINKSIDDGEFILNV